MKKSFKVLSLCLVFTTISLSTLPSVSTVYALENAQEQQELLDSELLDPVTSLTENEIEELANEIQVLHPDVSLDWIKEGIKRQLRGDYSIPKPIASSRGMLRASWQGITVNQMGALLDTAIALALGGTTAGLANLIKVKGKHAARSAIRSAIAKYLGSWFVNDVVLDIAMNMLSPGTYLAQLWDANDAVPNNGRINF